MPASPAMRWSPGRETRGDNHKRGRSLESGIVFKEREDDLALFNEVQSKETDNFLLQSNDDFEDVFVNKLRHFSDHKLGINSAARGESSDLLNAEEEKNDYEWLITPPDTPLFPSLDDEVPQVIPAERGRPRAQHISFSRSSTMEKSQRSSRGSASPNRLSSSPRSREPAFQSRSRASSGPSSSPPPTRRPSTGSKRPSSPSSKPRTPPPRASTPTSRRLSTGSVSNTTTGVRGVSPVKTSRGNSASPKVKAWQANIPGFSTEAPPNLRTSLADRPATYVRGSSPASRNGRHSRSPSASRSISTSHSHDRDRFSSNSKGSVASSADDDDVESFPPVMVDGSEHSNSRRTSGSRNNNTNKALFAQNPGRTVSSSSAPKRSFDMALRQMDHRKGPRNMFRPLLSSVPTSNLYAGKASPAWNSSVTTSSNASSDVGTSGPQDIEGSEQIEDDATSEFVKVPNCNVDDEVLLFETRDSINEDLRNETHDISSSVHLADSQIDGFENLAQPDTASSVVADDDLPEVDNLNDMLICTRCGCKFSAIRPTEDDIKLCTTCRKLDSSLTISYTRTSIEVVESSQVESAMSDKDLDLIHMVKVESPEFMEVMEGSQVESTMSDKDLELTDIVKGEPPEFTSKGESQSEISRSKFDSVVKNDSEISVSWPQLEKCEPTQVNHQVTSQSSLSFDTEREQIQETIDFPKSNVDTLVKDDENSEISLSRLPLEKCEPTQVNHEVISQTSLDYSDTKGEQIQHAIDIPKSKVDSSEGEGISLVLKSSCSIKGPVNRSGNFSASSVSYDDLSYVRDSTNSMRSSMGRGSVSASSSVDFGPRFQSQLSSKKFDIENYNCDTNVKHRRSVSSLSRTSSSHAFHPSSVGTSTLDSFEVSNSIAHVETDVADLVSVDPKENPTENDTCTENEGVTNIGQDVEEPTFIEKVEDLVKDTDILSTCTIEEGTSVNPCVETTDVALVKSDAIAEGELDISCPNSPASQSHVSHCSESSTEELQVPLDSTELGKEDMPASTIDCNTSNHSSSTTIEESVVLVEGQGRIKGRSLTLEEATETILFCSSIVHNLAYEAATIAIEKETPLDVPNNGSSPLIPAVGKGYSGRKDLQSRKTSKRSSKSQKTKRKTTEKDTTKAPNSTNTGDDETNIPKTRIVYPNDKENTKPPMLESKCNCRIM